MDSDYTSLLLHAEVKWLSRGRSLKRLLTFRYFPNDIDTQWICNPFSIEMEEINFLNLKAQEDFAELTSDTTLRLRFSQVPVHEFNFG